MAAKVWYSFKGGRSEEELGFYPKEDFPWAALLEQNAKIIAPEIERYIENNEEAIKPYFNKALVTKAGKWRTFAFFFWKWKVTKNMRECPKTIEVLRKVPGIVSASISILEPNIEIKLHRGDTNAIIRAHLALKAPVQLPDCGFQAAGEQRSWEEGKIFLFNDAAEHKAWNHSNLRRYVLLVDVIRPEFAHKKFTICSTVLSALMLQGFAQKLPILKKFPKIILASILYFNVLWINLVLRVRGPL